MPVTDTMVEAVLAARFGELYTSGRLFATAPDLLEQERSEFRRDLEAALSSAQDGWSSDMDGAPKDGTRIQLMCVKSPRLKLIPDILWIKVGGWRTHWQDGNVEGWREAAVAAPMDTSIAKLSPTHWAALPQPPAAGEQAMARTDAIHTLQMAGWAVRGPYKYARDLHQSFSINSPNRIVASVFCFDGNLARSEDEAIAMALAALRASDA